METIIVIFIIIFLLPAWLGQLISTVSYKTAVKLGLAESEAAVDPVFLADIKGEALWDMMILWILPVAGILFLLDNSWWIYFGLVGGGAYLYFAGRGIIVRIIMQRQGIPIGNPASVKIAYLFLSIWGTIALVTVILALSK